VPTRLLDGHRGYVMTDDYAGYNALAAQDGVERLGCWACLPHASSVEDYEALLPWNCTPQIHS
jgi:hypothetical protein